MQSFVREQAGPQAGVWDWLCRSERGAQRRATAALPLIEASTYALISLLRRLCVLLSEEPREGQGNAQRR